MNLFLQKGERAEATQSYHDDEQRKMSLIRLEVEKLNILEEELARNEERKKRKIEKVKRWYIYKNSIL